MRGIEFFQLKVGRVSFAIAHHHHRDLFRPRATRAANTAASASRPGQAALSLERRQKEGFARFEALRKRCRHKKAVFLWMPQCSAACLTVSPSIKDSA